MTLQETIQRLLEIPHKRKELTSKIRKDHLHTEENQILYERWINMKGEDIRHKLCDKIADGDKRWEELLELFPSPDKPFKIDDVKDEGFKFCIQEIERLDKEEHELFSYALETFKSEEGGRKLVKDYLTVRFPRLAKHLK